MMELAIRNQLHNSNVEYLRSARTTILACRVLNVKDYNAFLLASVKIALANGPENRWDYPMMHRACFPMLRTRTISETLRGIVAIIKEEYNKEQ
jgi:hypothetical protein